MTKRIGTPKYMAPEVTQGHRDYGYSVDVYSFLIVLWQLVIDCIDFEKMNNSKQLRHRDTKEAITTAHKVRQIIF